MIKVKAMQAGWIVALVLVGAMVSGGFQAPTLKIGSADMDKVLQSSNYWTSSESSYNAFTQRRQDLLKFFSQYRSMSSEQIKSLRDLAIKDTPTSQDNTEMERVKSQVVADDNRQKELATKQNPTNDEKQALNRFAQQADQNQSNFETISQEFSQEAGIRRDKILKDGMDKVRLAVQTVGKAQGYSVVLSAAAAPYCSNDVTEDAIKAMNAQKPM